MQGEQLGFRNQPLFSPPSSPVLHNTYYNWMMGCFFSLPLLYTVGTCGARAMTSSHGGFRYQTCILPACLAACTTGSRENIHRNTKRGSSPGRSLLFRFDVADEDDEEEDEEGKEEEGDVHISSGVSHSLSACLRVRACVCVCADM